MNTSVAEELDSRGVLPAQPVEWAPRKLALVGPGCRFLRREREVLERLLPGADARLAGLPFMLLETSVAPGIRLLKDVGLPQLVISTASGGLGASALETAQIHRAIASRSPSLGLAATMHSFAARTLVEYAACGDGWGGDLLKRVAGSAAFLASGFTEAGPGMRPLELSLRAIAGPDGRWTVSGSKKPCTLSRSMDYLSAGVLAVDAAGKLHRAVALIPGDLPGVSRRSLGVGSVLAGSENDELILKNVVVPAEMVFLADDPRLDSVELRGGVWLELCLGATYVGMASALVERVLARGAAVGSADRVALWSDTEAAMAAVASLAGALDQPDGTSVHELLARGVSIRLGARAALERATRTCAELLREAAGSDGAEVEYLLGLPRALAFHPSSRTLGAQALAAYLDGDELEIR